MKRDKTRNPVARALRTPKFKPRVVRDKRARVKHKHKDEN